MIPEYHADRICRNSPAEHRARHWRYTALAVGITFAAMLAATVLQLF